jgi:ABC-type microcin C transport system permease subunit YejE
MSVLVPLILLLLALSGTPLFVVIAASAIWGFYQTDVDLMVMKVVIYWIAEMPVLFAIWLFTFAG